MDHTGELSISQILDGGNSTSYLLCQSFRSPESISDPLGLYLASSQGSLSFWLGSCRIWFRFCWRYVSSNMLHVIFVFFQGFSNAMIRGSGERQSGGHTCTAQKYQTLLTHPLRETLKKKKKKKEVWQVAFSWKSLVDNLRNILFTPQKVYMRANFKGHFQWAIHWNTLV